MITLPILQEFTAWLVNDNPAYTTGIHSLVSQLMITLPILQEFTAWLVNDNPAYTTGIHSLVSQW